MRTDAVLSQHGCPVIDIDPDVIDIKPALKYFIQRGTDPAMLFSMMPCAFFEHHVAAGRTPAEIYEIAYGRHIVTCRPKPDRRRVPQDDRGVTI